jgi:2-isopropylmalate synthase
VAGHVRKSRVAALARAVDGDIERAAASVENAEKPVLHTFIATSAIHMEHKLRMAPEAVLEAAGKAVAKAKSLIPRVEFSAEDATRSDWDFLAKITAIAIEAGADIINLPDTVGYTTPDEIRKMFEYVIANAAGSDNVIFSTHNHNDLGLAVANAMAAVQGGARQIECTVNGIGERAGNTSLEEVVMAMRTRHDVFPVECGIITRELVPASKVLSNITGLSVPYNKPVVGRNAFAHESGIHQHGVIANASTYEIMTPESVGRNRSDLVLGKHSGRAGLTKRAGELGYALSESELKKLYEKFIELTDKKKEVYEDDLRLLIAALYNESFEVYHLDQLRTSGQDPTTAFVRLAKGEEVFMDTAYGDGPVHAACMAIERITEVSGRLDRFEIRATTPGKDAVGEAFLTVIIDGKPVSGHGSSTDIVEAAVRAWLNAVNKYLAMKNNDAQNQKRAADRIYL